MTSAEVLFNFEKELHQSSVRKSERVKELLSDDFFEFGSSGRFFDKEITITSLGVEEPIGYEAKNFSANFLSSDLALITYTTAYRSTPPRFALRSSLWRKESNSWRMVFHQGTLTTEDMFETMRKG